MKEQYIMRSNLIGKNFDALDTEPINAQRGSCDPRQKLRYFLPSQVYGNIVIGIC